MFEARQLYNKSVGYDPINFDGKLLFRILGMILHQSSQYYSQTTS